MAYGRDPWERSLAQCLMGSVVDCRAGLQTGVSGKFPLGICMEWDGMGWMLTSVPSRQARKTADHVEQNAMPARNI